jgi:hypothetical protein
MDRNDAVLMELLEEELPLDEPADMLRTIPEFRQWVDPESHDDELGLRSILEHPEALSRAWRRGARAKPRLHRNVKRRADVLRAA